MASHCGVSFYYQHNIPPFRVSLSQVKLRVSQQDLFPHCATTVNGFMVRSRKASLPLRQSFTVAASKKVREKAEKDSIDSVPPITSRNMLI